MDTFFLVVALLCGALLLIQLALDVLGGIDLFDLEASTPGDALNLRSARALMAGGTLFGIAGLGSMAVGLPSLAALPVALVAGSAVTFGVAVTMRAMHRLEGDGAIRMQGALGHPGTVYLTIPGGRTGSGKVHLALQDRTVEVLAVTAEGELATGTPIIVVDVIDEEIVEVALAPSLGGLLNG
jgi:hypothetical protein